MNGDLVRRRILGPMLSGLGKLPLPLIQGIGATLGLFLWYGRSRMALVTSENLALCFPEMSERARKALARSSLMETGKTIVESAFAWTASPERCRRQIVQVEGKAEVDAAIAEGHGLIFVIPHLGNWEMINHYLGPHYGLTHMYQPNRLPSLNAMIQQWRARTGTRFVETDRHGIKAQLVALRSGATIGAMPDQEPEVHTGEFAPFFGVPCLTTTLISHLAHRTGARVVVSLCQRLDAGFRIRFSPVELSADSQELSLAALNAGIEAAIRTMPAQYLWSYKRFRTRPAGLPEVYQFRQHPLRVLVEKTAISLWLAVAGRVPVLLLRRAGSVVGDAIRFARLKYARNARTNIALCAPALGRVDVTRLEHDCLRELGKTAMETAKIWHAGDAELNAMVNVNGLEYLYEGATIVLTPPLGHREVVMRVLGARYRVTEFYHPKSNTALDDIIRGARAAMGIRLVPHSEDGLNTLKARLALGEVVTLCPDQQPRLRWGEFVPFFGVAALTPSALACLVRESGANVVLAAAIREEDGFQVMFAPCEIDTTATARCLLLQINRTLERAIGANLAQYRWSDKRFNIRPPGERKVYGRLRTELQTY